MKLPTPKKLPSGAWRVQLMIDGQRVSRTFPTEKKAVRWAAEVKTDHKKTAAQPLTVEQAFERYIDSKDAVLSPSTVAGYKRIKENHFQDIMHIKVESLMQEQVQRSVNEMAKTLSPKTVHNAYGLLTAVLSVYNPDAKFNVTLPQKRRTDVIIPTEQDIDAITQAVKGTSVEAPTLLAMWLGLRMSEIRGLTWDCISNHTIHIKQARVDEGVKTTKTYNSNRILPLPDYIEELISKLPHDSEFIFPQSRRAIASRFNYWTDQAGIKHYRFHDLRHIQASVMLALNVPDMYAMKRMGHATPNMLHQVYEHTMPEQERKIGETVSVYFDKSMKRPYVKQLVCILLRVQNACAK